jgi:hypothetical protein
MPTIEIDINKTKSDPIIMKLGDIELTVRPDFNIKDQKRFYEIERDFTDPDIPKNK